MKDIFDKLFKRVFSKKRIKSKSKDFKNFKLNKKRSDFSSDVMRANGKLKGTNKKKELFDRSLKFNQAIKFDS